MPDASPRDNWRDIHFGERHMSTTPTDGDAMTEKPDSRVDSADSRPDPRPPSLADALIPIIALAVLIAGSLALFGLDALDGPLQVALILCCAIVTLILFKNGREVARQSGAFALPQLMSWLRSQGV